MPKRVPEEEKRVPLNCLVSPATLRWLKANGPQGQTVDRAVWALRTQEIKRETAAANADPVHGLVGIDLHEDLWKKLSPRPFKGPIPKPKDKKNQK